MTAKDFFKKYSFFPPLAVLATNLISSFLTRIFTAGAHIYDIVTAFDKSIPFVPEFIYVYVLAFVQWAICLVFIMVIDRKKCWYYCIAASLGNLLSGVVFLVFPTVMTIRPEFSGGGALTEFIGRFIFAADSPPMNIFPSLHCLHSWACARMIFSLGKVPASLKITNAVFSVLVFLSVLFVKQHLIFDVPTGIIAFEAGILITKLSGVDKKLSELEMRILSR